RRGVQSAAQVSHNRTIGRQAPLNTALEQLPKSTDTFLVGQPAQLTRGVPIANLRDIGCGRQQVVTGNDAPDVPKERLAIVSVFTDEVVENGSIIESPFHPGLAKQRIHLAA